MEVTKGPTKPGSYRQLRKRTPSPYQGEGDTDYLCGTCGFAVCKNIDYGQVSEMTLVCPICGSHNATPT